MSRQRELNKVKKLIKEFYDDGNHSLFSTRNIVGDHMWNLFYGNHFNLDICYDYSYFELFGATEKEFNKVMKFYNKLGGN